MSIELDEAKLRHPSSGVLQEVIATNSVRAFNSGVEHGVRLERGRIADKLREKAADLVSDGDMGSSELMLLSRLIDELERELK